MKTSKQNSQEIMEKIEKRKYARLQLRKKLRYVWATVVVLAFFLPTTLFSVTEDFNRYRPMSYPYQQEEPQEEDPGDSEMQNPAPNVFQTALPL